MTLHSLSPRFSSVGMVHMKNQIGASWLKSRPRPDFLMRKNSRESPPFNFRPVEGFPGQSMTTKALSLHTHCNMVRPLKVFLPNFSTWLRHLLTYFSEWLFVGKLEISAMEGSHFCSHVAKETNYCAVLKRVLTLSAKFPLIHTWSSQINLYEGEIKVYQNKPLCAWRVCSLHAGIAKLYLISGDFGSKPHFSDGLLEDCNMLDTHKLVSSELVYPTLTVWSFPFPDPANGESWPGSHTIARWHTIWWAHPLPCTSLSWQQPRSQAAAAKPSWHSSTRSTSSWKDSGSCKDTCCSGLESILCLFWKGQRAWRSDLPAGGWAFSWSRIKAARMDHSRSTAPHSPRSVWCATAHRLPWYRYPIPGEHSPSTG